jgi:hypothetical protein
VNTSGGSAGGGGGTITVIAAGAIFATGGRIDATGGDGGDGTRIGWSSSPTQYFGLSGGGGGGSGGTICFISGDNISLTATVLDANGGIGGLPPTLASGQCNTCNGGGDGGKGIIFLMDPDGLISGLFPNGAGSYPTFAGGYLTISTFTTAGDRFGETHAVTELFNIPAANPRYLELDQDNDILANVQAKQEILIFASSARADPANPLQPDITTEIPAVLVARVYFDLGAVQIDADSYMAMSLLNPGGPNRDAYLRMDAKFEYENLVEAALGPFAFVDLIEVTYSFNG